jgi:hypothetical protein
METAMNHDKPLARGEYRSDNNLRQGKPRDANRDPITGTPGAHPVGTGLGAAAGGMAAGAAVGTMAGPVGTAVGAALGAVAGGLVGKGMAEAIDPTAEDAFWREHYLDQPYVPAGATYDDYQPAFRYGLDAYSARYAVGSGLGFDEVEPELATGWERARGESALQWPKARHAARDAWQRAHETIARSSTGDAGRDMSL